VNNAAAWTFPEIANEKPEDRDRALADWERHVSTLDTAILSLIGENDIPDDGIETALDDILQSSLWHRRLHRQPAPVQQVLRAGLLSRSRLIWSQSTAARRRGYFLAGVGLTTGHALDAIAADANLLLIQANGSLLAGDAEGAITAITELAERVFNFYPFTPDPLPTNWRNILRAWLLGQPLAALRAPQSSEMLQFVEGGLVYRLPWAMEAIRVRAAANGDTTGMFDLLLEDHELGLAVPAVETGTLNRSASILIQAGFNSRLAAIKGVADTGATFSTGAELRAWLRTPEIALWSAQPDWPTAETKTMWLEFVQEFQPADNRTWTQRDYLGDVQWFAGAAPSGSPLHVHHHNGQPLILSSDGQPMALLPHPLNPHRRGLLRVSVAQNLAKLDLSYLGPDDLWKG
jgi:hypothetical protein